MIREAGGGRGGGEGGAHVAQAEERGQVNMSVTGCRC